MPSLDLRSLEAEEPLGLRLDSRPARLGVQNLALLFKGTSRGSNPAPLLRELVRDSGIFGAVWWYTMKVRTLVGQSRSQLLRKPTLNRSTFEGKSRDFCPFACGWLSFVGALVRF